MRIIGRPRIRGRRFHFAQHDAHRLAIRAGKLAPDQIDRLNAVHALIDRCDAGVPIELTCQRLAHEAHAAMYLHAQTCHVDAHVRAPRLSNRCQQVFAHLGRRACLFVR